MQTKIAVGLLSAAALVGAGVIFLAYDTPQATAEKAQSGDDQKLLKERIRQLERRAERAALELQAMQQPGGTAERGPSDPSEPPQDPADSAEPPISAPLDDAAVIKAEEERVEARFGYYREALDDEPRDQSWASEMEERLLALETDVFSQRLKGTVIREAECRSTFCRLELQHSEKQQQRIVTPFLYVEGLPRVAVRRVPAEDGKTLRSVAYLAQASLPPLPPDQGTMDP